MAHWLPVHVEQLYSMIILFGHYHQFPGSGNYATRMVQQAWSLNPIGAEFPDKSIIFVEYLYSVIVAIRDHDMAVTSAGDTFRVFKLALLSALGTELEHEGSLKVKDLDSVVVTICYNQVIVFIVNGHAPGHVEFTCKVQEAIGTQEPTN